MNTLIANIALVFLCHYGINSPYSEDSLITHHLLGNHISVKIPITCTRIKTRKVKDQNLVPLKIISCVGIQNKESFLTIYQTDFNLQPSNNGMSVWNLVQDSKINKIGKFVKSGYTVRFEKMIYYVIYSSFEKELNDDWTESYHLIFISEMNQKLIYGHLKTVSQESKKTIASLGQFLQSIDIRD